ncbi:MAG: hypothetical protein GQ574_02200 [Crocinitomix sp.]|nr:hypothetical protein [Crocinitomix sp.]
MKTITSFFNGFSYALKLVHKQKLYGYFVPAAILAIIFYLLFSGGSYLSGGVSFMEDWWVIGWLISSTTTFFGFISFMIFEFFILVLLSPVNSFFAEKAREDLTGEKLGFSLAVFLRSLRRTLAILFVGLLMQIGLGILLWLLSFLLGDHFYEIASIVNIAFFVGFSFFDFGLELDEVNSKDSRRYARKNWLACIVLGLVFNLGIYLPQKTGLIMLYAAAIAVLPHLLTIAASKMYYESLADTTNFSTEIQQNPSISDQPPKTDLTTSEQALD